MSARKSHIYYNNTPLTVRPSFSDGFRCICSSTQEQQDIEHNAASAGASALFHGYSPIPPNSKLIRLQNLVGIQSQRTMVPGRPAPNPGIYKRTVDEEGKAHYGYVLTT